MPEPCLFEISLLVFPHLIDSLTLTSGSHLSLGLQSNPDASKHLACPTGRFLNKLATGTYERPDGDQGADLRIISKLHAHLHAGCAARNRPWVREESSQANRLLAKTKTLCSTRIPHSLEASPSHQGAFKLQVQAEHATPVHTA